MKGKFISEVFGSSSGAAEHSSKMLEPSISERLNDQVYLLRSGTNPQIDVVFFHGLPKKKNDVAKTYWKTWTMRDNPRECWPITLLPELLATKSKESGDPVGYDPRVLAVSWDLEMELRVIETGLPRVKNPFVETLVQDLILSDDVGAGQDRPVILVGHDWGGILIKQLILCVAGDEVESGKHKKFLDNLGSVFFYATPYSESSTTELSTLARNVWRQSSIAFKVKHLKGILRMLRMFVGSLDLEFVAYRSESYNQIGEEDSIQLLWLQHIRLLIRETSSVRCFGQEIDPEMKIQR